MLDAHLSIDHSSEIFAVKNQLKLKFMYENN
jgi:hypothetical protein